MPALDLNSAFSLCRVLDRSAFAAPEPSHALKESGELVCWAPLIMHDVHLTLYAPQEYY